MLSGVCLPCPSCAQGLIPIQGSVRCQLSSGAIPTPSLKQPLPSIVPNGSLCFLLITAHVSLRPLVTCSLPDLPRHKVSSLRTAVTCVLSAHVLALWTEPGAEQMLSYSWSVTLWAVCAPSPRGHCLRPWHHSVASGDFLPWRTLPATPSSQHVSFLGNRESQTDFTKEQLRPC